MEIQRGNVYHVSLHEKTAYLEPSVLRRPVTGQKLRVLLKRGVVQDIVNEFSQDAVADSDVPLQRFSNAPTPMPPQGGIAVGVASAFDKNERPLTDSSKPNPQAILASSQSEFNDPEPPFLTSVSAAASPSSVIEDEASPSSPPTTTQSVQRSSASTALVRSSKREKESPQTPKPARRVYEPFAPPKFFHWTPESILNDKVSQEAEHVRMMKILRPQWPPSPFFGLPERSSFR